MSDYDDAALQAKTERARFVEMLAGATVTVKGLPADLSATLCGAPILRGSRRTDADAEVLRAVTKAALDLYEGLASAANDLYEIADFLPPGQEREMAHKAWAAARMVLDRHRMDVAGCQCDIVGDGMPSCPAHR